MCRVAGGAAHLAVYVQAPAPFLSVLCAPLRQGMALPLAGSDSTLDGRVAALLPMKWIVPWPVHLKLLPAG